MFASLTHMDKWAYSSFIVAVVALLIHWRLGCYAMLLMTVVHIIRLFTLKHLGNPHINRPSRVCLWLMIAYWVLYIVSALFCANKEEAWETVLVKLPFVVFPLIILSGDTGYLDGKHIRGLFYVMLGTLIIRFLISVVISVAAITKGVPVSQSFYWEFDPLGLHHNYLGLYITIALAFLYTDIQHYWKRRNRTWKYTISITMAVLLTYMLLSYSRSTIVTTVVLIAVALLHITVSQGNWLSGVIVFSACVLLCIGLQTTAPRAFARFGVIITNIKNGQPGDDRIALAQYAWKTMEDHWLWGYGSGDYMPTLMTTYEKYGYQDGLKYHYGSHNQYLETLLETGIIGLAILLVMLLTPLATHIRHNKRHLLTLMVTSAIMSQIFFESMFNRSMSVQMAALCYCLIIVDANRIQSKTKNEELVKEE